MTYRTRHLKFSSYVFFESGILASNIYYRGDIDMHARGQNRKV